MIPGRHEGELKRAEPDTELHCSPVLRSYVVTTRLRHPPSLSAPLKAAIVAIANTATTKGGQ